MKCRRKLGLTDYAIKEAEKAAKQAIIDAENAKIAEEKRQKEMSDNYRYIGEGQYPGYGFAQGGNAYVGSEYGIIKNGYGYMKK